MVQGRCTVNTTLVCVWRAAPCSRAVMLHLRGREEDWWGVGRSAPTCPSEHTCRRKVATQLSLPRRP